MASSTSTMEVDEGEKKAEEDDISSKAKKYVAEKRKLAGGGATVGKELQHLCPLGPARPVLFLKSKPTLLGHQTLTVRTRPR